MSIPIQGKPDRSGMALRVLTLDGLMVALSIVLTRLMSLNIPIGGGIGARIGLGHLPIRVCRHRRRSAERSAGRGCC